MPPREGLPGLDTSLAFSAEPLDHLFIVIHGAGDPYVDHQPWMSSLESSLAHLQRNYDLVVQQQTQAARRASTLLKAPSVLFLPVEWHRPAFESWQAEIRHAEPRPAFPGAPTTVRDAVAEMTGDVLMLASPFWRKSIARHLSSQIASQVAAVRRNRPAFSGHISLLAHSIAAMLAVELIHRDLLVDLQLDSVVLAGCPIVAYAALAPDGGHQISLATIRKERNRIRFINVFHPLDPVAYRIEPFVLAEGETLQSAIRVTPQKRTFWDDASMFWDDVVYNLWSTLFPERPGAAQRRRASDKNEGTKGMADLFSIFGGNQRGKERVEQEEDDVAARSPETRLMQVSNPIGMRRSSSYVVQAPKRKPDEEEDVVEEKDVRQLDTEEAGGEDNKAGEYKTGGSEVLLSDRIDYELQDGMGVPPLDVMASWGAIKAHTYYWQSLDVAQMLLDIATTSDDAMASR